MGEQVKTLIVPHNELIPLPLAPGGQMKTGLFAIVFANAYIKDQFSAIPLWHPESSRVIELTLMKAK